MLIATDGTQHPPIQFPPGGHLMQFLTCVESSLLPYGMLDPPLWSERKQKEQMRIDSNSLQKQSAIQDDPKDTKIIEKEEGKSCDSEESKQNKKGLKTEENDTNSSSAPKKPKRLFPSFSLSRRKKEV